MHLPQSIDIPSHCLVFLNGLCMVPCYNYIWICIFCNSFGGIYFINRLNLLNILLYIIVTRRKNEFIHYRNVSFYSNNVYWNGYQLKFPTAEMRSPHMGALALVFFYSGHLPQRFITTTKETILNIQVLSNQYNLHQLTHYLWLCSKQACYNQRPSTHHLS